MSGIADSPAGLHCGAYEPLRFGEFLARINRGERIQRAAERRSAAAAGGEECRRTCHAPAAPEARAPRLAEVSPVALRATYPPPGSPGLVVQQLLPTGSIIDVTV
jgi:hypothetical protein